MKALISTLLLKALVVTLIFTIIIGGIAFFFIGLVEKNIFLILLGTFLLSLFCVGMHHIEEIVKQIDKL